MAGQRAVIPSGVGEFRVSLSLRSDMTVDGDRTPRKIQPRQWSLPFP